MLALPQTRHLLVLDVVTHLEFRHQRLLSYVPQATGLVARCSQQALAVRAPGHGVDTSFVGWTAQFAYQFRSLSVVNKHLAVESTCSKLLSVGRIAHRLHETSVFRFGSLELERRT